MAVSISAPCWCSIGARSPQRVGALGDAGLQALVVLPAGGVGLGEQLVEGLADLALACVQLGHRRRTQQHIEPDAEQALLASGQRHAQALGVFEGHQPLGVDRPPGLLVGQVAGLPADDPAGA